MSRRRKVSSTFLFVATICSIILLGVNSTCAVDMAPDFTLPDLEGRNITLSSNRGKVVIVNFWGTWCEPCKAEMPSLNRLYLESRDKGLVVLAVSIDPSSQKVRSFITQKGYSFPVLLDSKKEVFFDTYGLFGLPVSVIIDRSGVIVQKVIGEAAWDAPPIKGKIQKLLDGRKI